MAVAEPDNELWTAVKAISNPWPPDDEEEVARVADDWRKAGETADLAGTELYRARQASEQAWRDQGGDVMAGRLSGGVVTLESQRQGAEQQAALADRYAQALINVKNAIVHTINTNLPVYLQLGNPLYGAVGLAQQQAFAHLIARQLQEMVAAQTQGLQAPPRAPESDTALGALGDWAGAVSAVAGGLALIPGAGVVAAPVALLSGAVALAAHAADMIATESYDDPYAIAGLLGDTAGMFPGVRALSEAAGLASQAPKAIDYLSSGLDVLLQVPTAVDHFTDNDFVDDSKDAAGGAAPLKILGFETARRMMP